MKASTERYTIDANFILRYILRDVEEHYQKAVAIMDALWDGRISVYCDPVTLSEVVWVLKSFYSIPADVIRDTLKPILTCEGFVLPEKQSYLRALDMFAASISHFGDACACADALEKSKGKLLSFDRKLSNVPDIIRVEDLG